MLHNSLVKFKNLTIGRRKKQPEKHPEEEFIVNNKRVETAPGSCTSYNVIYLVIGVNYETSLTFVRNQENIDRLFIIG